MATTQVIPIKVGSIIRDGTIVVDARSSVTMIDCDDLLILVDTGQVGEEKILTEALVEKGFSKSEINIVVNTHLHLDHCGCNDLFKNAIFYADKRENPPIHFRSTPDGAGLASGVRFMSTPGHTAGSISVVAETGKKVHVIAGDAIPTYENYEKMTPPAININQKLAIESMKRIIERADFIIPGHGAMFAVNR